MRAQLWLAIVSLAALSTGTVLASKVTGAARPLSKLVHQGNPFAAALHAEQVGAVAQLKAKLAEENISWAEVARYATRGMTSRFFVKQAVDDIEAQKYSTLYQQLLAALAEDSEHAELVLAQYFKGERTLNEHELIQVCLHSACTFTLRPMFAVERVLDEYLLLDEKIANADGLSREEKDTVARALEVYQRQEKAETSAVALTPVQEQHAAVKKAAHDEQAKLSAEAKRKEEAKEAARQFHATQRELKSETKKQAQYAALEDKLNEIMSILSLEGMGGLSDKQLFERLAQVGFTPSRKSKHRLMQSPTGIVMSASGPRSRHEQGTVVSILAQARAIRFMEELRTFSTEAELGDHYDWLTARTEFITHLDSRQGEAGNDKLKDALSNIDTRLKKMGIDL